MAKTSSAKKKEATAEIIPMSRAARGASKPALERARAPRRDAPIVGIVLGTLGRVDDGGPCVRWAGATREVRATTTVPLRPADVGRTVALAFDGGDARRPIVLGLVHDGASSHVVVEADGQHVLVEAAKKLTLRCGKASLTLTRSGKIVLRGAYVVSRSSGTNRVQGTVVEIN